MARRVKIGGDRQTTTGGAGQQKSLASVEVESGDSSGGGFMLNLMSGGDAERELTQEQVFKAYHTSPILQMAVAPIVRTVGEVLYQWEDGNEPADFSLERPNRWHQSAEHFGLAAAYLKLGGEYIAIKNDTAKGVELWPIPADDIEGPETYSGKWQLEDGAVGGLSRTEFDREELLVIQNPDLSDPYMHGRGAGQTVGHDVDIDEAAAEHTATYLENHAKPDAVIGIEGAKKDDLKRFRDSMRQKHGGPGNSGKLEAFAGDVSVETLMQPFDELGTPELREASRKISQYVFGTPPVMMGAVEDVNRNTAETQEVVFKKHVIKPLVDKIVEAHNEQFVRPELGEQYAITTGQIVPANTERRLAYAKEHPGAVYANESRQWVGLDARDELEGQTLADTKPAPAAPQQRSAEPAHGKGGGKKKHTAHRVTKEVDDPRIQQVLDAVDAEDMDELRDRFAEAMRAEAEQTISGLGEAFGGGLLDDAVEAKVDERFAWVLDDMARHTREEIADRIVEGLDEGENPRRVAQRVRETYDEDFATWRAERIARTEMLTASNAGTWTAHKESDVVEWRSWLSTRDGNVRPAHVTLDERTSKDPIKVDQPFNVAGEQAMHPGDFASARLSVNCRCSTVAEFPDEASRSRAEREKLWSQFVKRLDEQEQQTKDVVQRAFRAQRDKVLAAFSDAFGIELEAVA